MTFDLFTSFNGKGTVCTPDLLTTTIDTQKMRDSIQNIREFVASKCDAEVARLKKKLPSVTWQAHFADGKRCSTGAIPSGLYMLDVDDVADARSLGQQWVDIVEKGPLKDLVAVIHISPSGRGLRVVARCADPALDTIEKNQAWLAAQLGLTSYDKACKDLARLAFLVSKDDFLLLNVEMLEREGMVTVKTERKATRSLFPKEEHQEGQKSAAAEDDASLFRYRGKLISEIAEEYVKKYGAPVQGERNNTYYNMCLQFRNITDNKADILVAQLPDFGLSLDERRRTAESSTKYPPLGCIPSELTEVLLTLGLTPGKEASADEDDDEYEETPLTFPDMPSLFREYCDLVPDAFKWPLTAAMLPIIGTMTTRLRATYLDNVKQSTTFHSVIIAPPSSGKSIMSTVYHELTKDFEQRDAEGWSKEDEYNRQRSAKRNVGTLPDDPHTLFRLLSPKISVSQMLKRQADAQGIHQLAFTSEVDTLAKGNKGGRTMDKNDIYRQAWDNEFYSQDYMSENTYSGQVQLFANFLLTGTPEQVRSFYGTPENGLVSRVMFAHINGQKFVRMPKLKTMKAKTKERMEKIVQQLNATCYAVAEDGTETIRPVMDITRQMAFFKDPLDKWLEKRRLESLADFDESKDQYRKRAAVKAFRSAMVAVAIYDFNPTKEERLLIRDWALWIADMDLQEHLEMYAKKTVSVKKGSVNGLLCSLPETMNKNDVETALGRNGNTTNPTTVISRWVQDKLIEKVSKNTWVKTKLGLSVSLSA